MYLYIHSRKFLYFSCRLQSCFWYTIHWDLNVAHPNPSSFHWQQELTRMNAEIWSQVSTTELQTKQFLLWAKPSHIPTYAHLPHPSCSVFQLLLLVFRTLGGCLPESTVTKTTLVTKTTHSFCSAGCRHSSPSICKVSAPQAQDHTNTGISFH